MADRVRVDIGDDHVATISLARPDKLNALDHDTFQGLHDAAAQLTDAVEERAVRAALLRGDGRAFCAGLDVALFAQSVSGFDDEQIAWLQAAFTKIEDLAVPVVAALRGACVGGGLQLALAAHLRVAAADTSLGLLEARWALVPDLGGTYRLPRLVGLSRATDLALTARTIDAPTAERWGLVDAVHPVEELDRAAHAHAAMLAAGPTTATGAVPSLMRANLDRDRTSALAAERAAQARCLASADFAEARAAALEGRAARFSGR